MSRKGKIQIKSDTKNTTRRFLVCLPDLGRTYFDFKFEYLERLMYNRRSRWCHRVTLLVQT